MAAKANALFLGPQLPGMKRWRGGDYPIYDADPARLWKPLTRAEYDSIFAYTTYHPESETQTLALTLSQGELFQLPGTPSMSAPRAPGRTRGWRTA